MFHKKKFKEIEIKATPGDAPSQKSGDEYTLVLVGLYS